MALYISQGLRSLFDIYTALPEPRILCLPLAKAWNLQFHRELITTDIYG